MDPYYKFANPVFVQELDWAITFSKYDFPWREIRFGKFSAKECYLKYTSTIRDSSAFLKKVLGSKEKFKKLMASFIDEPPRIFFGTSPEEEGKEEAEPTEGLAQAVEAAQESDAEQFCRCKGTFKSVTGYFVACESDSACPNGGWLHPECTTDLAHLTKEQIDTIAAWYCEECREQRLDEGDADEEGELEDEDEDEDADLISLNEEDGDGQPPGSGSRQLGS